jgi:homoserine dehydrogenase
LSAVVLREARNRGCAIRLVASCRSGAAGLEARVAPVELPINHPFARLKDAENGFIIETENGARPIVCGTGAGRWPTTEAVIADLFAIRCELSAAESISEELEGVVA